MNNKITLFCSVILVCTGAIFSKQGGYDNFHVYRVIPRTKDSVSYLHHLALTSKTFEFWSLPTRLNQNVDVLVAPYYKEEFENAIDKYGIESSILIKNLQYLIDNQRPTYKKINTFDWTDYHTLEEIYKWLAGLVVEYPGKVSLEKAGASYEGRDILGVRVSFAPGNENKSVFIESNIHACEWIGSAVSTYILNQLLTSTDSRVRAIADNHDWYVFPIFNPDGFVYSHTTNRTWRKTRVPHGEDCFGADPNRNWGYHFNEGGASDDPCSEYYNGPAAFSEPETKSISEYISKIGSSLEGYISFHSYAQILLLPYGYTPDHLDNYDELYAVGTKAIETLSQRYGTEYKIGDVAEVLYVASGGSPDWVKGTFGTKITYTYELRDNGTYGFLLPADQIIPTAEETFDSFLTIFEEFSKTN